MGPQREAKATCRQRERKELGNMALLGSIDKVFWSSQTKTKLVNSNQKSRLLVSPLGAWGDLIKGLHKVNALGSRGYC